MPELPEVETLCRQLNSLVVGRKIKKAQVLDARLGNIEGLNDRRIGAVQRHGKMLEFLLDDGSRLWIHLRMSGRLLWDTDGEQPSHLRWYVSFSDGRLLFLDPRRFGTVSRQKETVCTRAGLDALVRCGASQLHAMSTARTLPVKSFLISQQWVAGLGNIYVCEILHRAGISPWRRAGELTSADWGKIMSATRSILMHAICCRGTTVSDWRDLHGNSGEYQNHLAVYKRAGQPCLQCGDIVRRERLHGVGTYFCPNCQQ